MLRLDKLSETINYEGGVSRRMFLAYGAALASIPYLGSESRAAAHASFQDDPFSLGIASGDPNSDSVVLWTRLAPQPLEPTGGMGNEGVAVKWEIAEDEAMKKVVASGTETASPQLGHSVHAEAAGLKPDRWYWYRFRAGDAESPVGRTRTLPESSADAQQVKFAVASCQHFEQGYYAGYAQMARDDVDLVFHLGDYIYEGGGSSGRVRKHHGKEIKSLADYRVRHSQYRSDPLLHQMHARCPWFVTWDDHEVDNNYSNDVCQDKGVDPAQFLKRRANAYQAYYEMMPLRKKSLPRGPHMQLYRRAAFGKLADFFVLDTRQYRTDQPNNDKKTDVNAAAIAAKNTLLGKKQREWLYNSFNGAPAIWNVLAQQVMMGMVDRAPDADSPKYSMDQWPGYTHERRALVQRLADAKVSNPVVLTGDIHSNWANDLRVDDLRPEQSVVATEFVTTSMTSGGQGGQALRLADRLKAENPCVQFHNKERGYLLCKVTPGEWKTDFKVVKNVADPSSEVLTRASYVVEAGTPGAERA